MGVIVRTFIFFSLPLIIIFARARYQDWQHVKKLEYSFCLIRVSSVLNVSDRLSDDKNAAQQKYVKRFGASYTVFDQQTDHEYTEIERRWKAKITAAPSDEKLSLKEQEEAELWKLVRLRAPEYQALCDKAVKLKWKCWRAKGQDKEYCDTIESREMDDELMAWVQRNLPGKHAKSMEAR